jgi:hypothetical protein
MPNDTTLTGTVNERDDRVGRWLRLVFVVITFLLLFSGLTTLAAVLNFFDVMQRSSADIITFYKMHGPTLQGALIATLLGYLFAVPIMAMVTQHYQPANRPARFGGLMLGILWASLALRPLWWAAHIVLLPNVVALGTPGTDPAEIAAFMSTFRILDLVLNTVTEDIAVNVLGGAWFAMIGLEMLRRGGRMIVLGSVTMLIGVMFITSSAELMGFSFGEGGGIIPIMVSVAGPFWLLFVGSAVALRFR